jgi:cobalt-zinc-cadmium efflux system outer membrane protein
LFASPFAKSISHPRVSRALRASPPVNFLPRTILPRFFLSFLFAAAGAASPCATASEAVENPLTLARALALALAGNPDLAAFSWEIRAADARLIQARLAPNPELSMEAENITGTDEFKNGEEAERMFELRQLIELGGKRSARVAEARSGRDVAEWQYLVNRNDVLKETKQAFVEVLAAQRRVELAEEALGLSENALPFTQKRVEVGQAPLVEATRAHVAIALARIGVEQARRQLQIARGHLAAKWGARSTAFGDATGRLEQLRPIPAIATLRSRILANPEVARWAFEREKRAAALRLARAQAAPDVTIGAGPRIIGKGDATTLGTVSFSMPLPFFDRNQGHIAEARAHLSKTDDEERGAEARAFAALNEAYQTVLRAAEEVRLLQNAVLPGAQNAVEQLVAGYETGRVTQLEIIDARRTLTDARTQHLRALADYHKAFAEIDALTASPVDLRHRSPPPAKRTPLHTRKPTLRK